MRDLTQKANFQQNEIVTVHSIDNTGRTWRARICGKSFEHIQDTYIIEMIDALADPGVYPFTHCTMTEACLRRGWDNYPNPAYTVNVSDVEVTEVTKV